MKLLRHTPDQRGFTIVELMIATSVLSVILLLVTGLMISIGNLFYKGVNQARVQDSVRSISDDLTQQLKFTGSPVIEAITKGSVTINGAPRVTDAICIGDVRYSFIKGYQIGTGTNQIDHVLWKDKADDSGTCPPVDLSTNLTDGTELIPPNSRLTEFKISPSSPYTINVGIAYGDDDLLNNPTAPDVTCIGGTGQQYCATASLQTVAVNRLGAGL